MSLILSDSIQKEKLSAEISLKELSQSQGEWVKGQISNYLEQKLKEKEDFDLAQAREKTDNIVKTAKAEADIILLGANKEKKQILEAAIIFKENIEQREKAVGIKEKNHSEEIEWHDEKKKRLEQRLGNIINEATEQVKAENIRLAALMQSCREEIKRLCEENICLRTSIDVAGASEKQSLLSQLEKIRKKLDQLGNITPEEVQRLQKIEDSEKKLRIEYGVQMKENTKLNEQLSEAKKTVIDKASIAAELESLKREKEIIEREKNDLYSLLGQIHQIRENTFPGFANLRRISEERIIQSSKPIPFKDLTELARHARNWMASLPSKQQSNGGPHAHWYDELVSQVFVASLGTAMRTSRLIIIQGVSGTGKSSLPRYFAKSIGAEYRDVPVQSSWRDKNDLVGMYNSFARMFRDTEFSRALYEASRYPQTPFFIILDEMNLSRIEHYFADFISVMEQEENARRIELMDHDPAGNDGDGMFDKSRDGALYLKIPDNVWFIGTANTDESTFEITRRVYDRAQVVQLDHRANPFTGSNAAEPKLHNMANLKTLLQSVKPDERVDGWLKHHEEHFKALDLNFGERIHEQMKIFCGLMDAAGAKPGAGYDYFLAHKMLWPLVTEKDPSKKDKMKDLADALRHENYTISEGRISKAIKTNFYDA